MKWCLIIATVFAFVTVATAEDKKPDGPLVLKLIAKTDKYKFDGDGKKPADYKTALEEIAKKIEKGDPVTAPKALAVDFLLQVTNTSKEEVTIYVGGDPNVYTFELTGGAGSVSMNSTGVFTTEFRLPKAVNLAAGKSYDIPVKSLSDGNRGIARLLFWTGPGEYKLSAKYALSDKDGGKAADLTSEPVKITVTEK
jgi:hypothetical protein